MSYSPVLFDAGNIYVWVAYGAFLGIISFIIAVVSEFLLLRFGFKFLQKKRFLYILIANLASVLAGVGIMALLGLVFMSGRIVVPITLILSIIVEFFVLVRLTRSEDIPKKVIMKFIVIANLVSYTVIFGIPWVVQRVVALIMIQGMLK
jgi:hypothetical protein